MNTRGQVAGEVRAVLARRQITQTALADQITMSRASLSASLNGLRAFDTDELAEIGAVLGVDPLAFLLPVSEEVSA
jgi:transcriptional regulator with XRE-family HTH domain